MSAQKPPHDRLFEYAQKYWVQLQEFVDNSQEATDYLLKRVKAECEFLKSNESTVDFNQLYRQRFCEFVIHSHDLITKQVGNSPLKRCNFIVPDESENLEDILNETNFEETVEKRWAFLPDAPERYIKSINDIVKQLSKSKSKDWTKHTYVSETTARRYVGEVQDGTIYLTEKRILDLQFRTYGNFQVRIVAEKHFPEGPFLYYVDILENNKKIGEDRDQRNFVTEKKLEQFIEEKKKEFDANYLSQKEEL